MYVAYVGNRHHTLRYTFAYKRFKMLMSKQFGMTKNFR